MPDPKRKNRIISLRLSEQEYEALKVMYRAHGARSISDFARSAMNRIISSGPAKNGDTLELKVEELDGKISVLDSEVARLTQLIEKETSERKGGPNEHV